MKRYALYDYSTTNIGDEIQSLAARRFLPRVDCYVNRDTVGEVALPYPVRLIANGWYTKRPDLWPPENSQVTRLFTSIHLSDEMGSSLKQLTSARAKTFLEAHSPIGCRDEHTVELLHSLGVEAYLSGCLTLTLQTNQTKRDGSIYVVDVPKAFAEHIPPDVRPRVRFLGHIMGRRRPPKTWRWYRFMRARRLLECYASASLVITSRLHCALPCRAFNTPVVFAPGRIDDPRFKGLLAFLNAYPIERLLAGEVAIDWNSPTPNPGDIEPMRAALIEQCKTFVEGS